MPTGPLADPDWRLIVKRIHDEECLPFLGAGASLGNGSGLPTAYQLATALADECDYPGGDRSDLFRVAQYYQMKFDADALRSFVGDEILKGTRAPTTVHETIAALPFRYVITTNFDKLMERAFESARPPKTPHVALYKRHGDQVGFPLGTVRAPVVYKLHGTVDEPRTMVVTEDDVVEFLACAFVGDPPLPPSFKALFVENSILFIGYGLKDWNVRVLLRAIRERGGGSDKNSYAIQKCPTDQGLAQEWETCVIYWDRKENLRCFDMDAVEFAEELGNQYKKYYG